LIPKFILTKKYALFFIILSIALAIFYITRTGFNYFLVTKNIWPEAEGVQNSFQFNHILAVTLGEIYVVAFVATIKLTVEWVYQKQKVENLKKLQLRTELNFLKSQIQPHFFFNTLNNLYALTLVKSDIAPSVVLKLSDIMQYVLYDVKEPLIALTTEIKYIQNYLDLEEMRHGTTLKMKVSIKGEITGIMLPPLLFLPFIENCFKHGIKGNGKLKIKIGFKIVKNKKLIFTIENNFVDTSPTTKHGIGNPNVKRRLELLYQKKFELSAKASKGIYNVKMSLPINQNL
jgi:LytS/YehU family sensor histidine kinase